MEKAIIRGRRCIGELPKELSLGDGVTLTVTSVPDPSRMATEHRLILCASFYATDRMMLTMDRDEIVREVQRELWARLRRAVLDHG